MPGSIANAVVPTVDGYPLVLPYGLCTQFVLSQEWATRANEYRSGERQSQALVSTSRKSWNLRRRLSPAAMAILKAFWEAHPTDAFYYYDPFEPVSGHPVGSNYDPTGASTVGRYTVRFAGDWYHTISWPRSEVGIELVEIA